jgi:hypothetical protein
MPQPYMETHRETWVSGSFSKHSNNASVGFSEEFEVKFINLVATGNTVSQNIDGPLDTPIK